MTSLLLVRHGHTDSVGKTLSGRLAGVHLDQLGRQQAAALADRLARFEIAALYSSPRERALETAAPMASRLGVAIEVRDGLDEMDFGDWTGLSFEALRDRPLWKRYNGSRSWTRTPAGEHPLEVQARVVAELERIEREHPGQTVAAMTHAEVIRSALAYCLGASLDSVLRLEVSPASVSVVELGGDAPRVLAVNQRHPLHG